MIPPHKIKGRILRISPKYISYMQGPRNIGFNGFIRTNEFLMNIYKELVTTYHRIFSLKCISCISHLFTQAPTNELSSHELMRGKGKLFICFSIFSLAPHLRSRKYIEPCFLFFFGLFSDPNFISF